MHKSGFLLLVAMVAALTQQATTKQGLRRDDSDSCRGSSCQQASRPAFYCYCDPSCTTYGDCCHDANVTMRPPLNPKFSCVVPGGFGSNEYWTITTCSRSWIAEQLADGVINVNDVVSSCEDPSVRASFRFLPPVMDKKTGAVYQNQFCARCNGLQLSDVAEWRIQLNCKITERFSAYSQTNFTFSELINYCFIKAYLPPNLPLLAHARGCKPLPLRLISSCPDSTPNDLRENCTLGGLNLVDMGLSVYANRYCAACWRENSTESVSCYPALTFEISPLFELLPRSLRVTNFAILLDISNTGTKATSSSVARSVKEEVCPSGSVYDVFRGACRMLPSANCTNSTAITLEGGAYSLRGTDSVFWISYNLNVSIESVDNNGRPLVCIPSVESSACVPIILESNEYVQELNSSRTLVWASDNGVYRIEGYDMERRPLICTDLAQNFTANGTSLKFGYPIAFDILTYIGLSIDVVSCCLILLTFALFKELRMFFSKLMVNFVLSVVFGDIVFLLGGPLVLFVNISALCTAVAILLHYVFLCRFSWMTVMGLELVRSFYNMKKLNKSAAENWKLLSLYMLVGWLSPLVIVIPTIIVNFTVDNSVNYGVGNSCWINQATALIVSFIVPVGVSIILNTFSFIVVMVMLMRIRNRPMVASSDPSERKKQSLKDFRFAVTLLVLTGLSWLFGFLVLLSRDLSWAWYLFIIFNTTQALAVLVSLFSTKKVFYLYRSLLCCSRKGQSKDTITSKQPTTDSHVTVVVQE